MKHPSVFLHHMLDAITEIEAIQLSKESDVIALRAAERCIQIVGEAARKLPDSFHAAHPEIPWSKIIGLRNVIVHHYSDLDYDVIEDVVLRHLPQLKAQISAILAKEGE